MLTAPLNQCHWPIVKYSRITRTKELSDDIRANHSCAIHRDRFIQMRTQKFQCLSYKSGIRVLWIRYHSNQYNDFLI